MTELDIMTRDRARAIEFERAISLCTSLKHRICLSDVFLKWIRRSSPGIFASRAIEQTYYQLASTLPAMHQSEIRRGTCLVVMSEAYLWGGHTRWVEDWILCDSGRRYSIVFTRKQTNKLPPKLLAAVRNSGGDLFFLEEDATIAERGWQLRKLSADYEYILLSTHPDDPIPLIAYGTSSFKRPVATMNHCNHLFWIGIGISDAVIEVAEWQARITRFNRGCDRTYVIPMPFEYVPEMSISRNQARERLNIPICRKMILTAGQPYKYNPRDGLDFTDVIIQILRRDDKAYVYTLGSPENLKPEWKKIGDQYSGRVVMMDTVSHELMLTYCSAADVVVDSFPFTGGGVMRDATLCGTPCVTLNKDLGVDEGPYKHCDNVHDVISEALLFCDRKDYAQKFGADGRDFIINKFGKESVAPQIKTFVDNFVAKEHEVRDFHPQQTEIVNNDYTILATRYSKKYNIQTYFMFKLMLVKPYAFGRMLSRLFYAVWHGCGVIRRYF